MIRFNFSVVVSFVLIFSLTQTAQAGWPISSKPEFRGRIIDAETKEPIEEVVAVVYYSADMLIGGPGGPNYYVFHARECLTDKKGEFYFPAYASFHIISEANLTNFIFYKPGYMAGYGPENVSPILVEKYFSSGKAGETIELEGGTFEQGSYVKWKGPVGIVALKKGQRDPSIPTDYRSNRLPLLFKALNEDRKIRGYEGELK